MKMKSISMWIAGLALAVAGTAGAATDISTDITTDTEWTSAGNPYRLKTQIYVKDGATLTIQAGVEVRSIEADQGSLAICRGSKIYVNGTRSNPVIMTSDQDDGTARQACNEWGNLTIMGRGLMANYEQWDKDTAQYISPLEVQDGTSATPRENTKIPDGENRSYMEGLVAAEAGDPNVVYGGNNDDDNSGTINYLSLRYGGKVVNLANELNGLSLGAVGRETEIDYVDIYNNVDDGIEIWGGAVNLKHVSIWNIGDDSFDVDQGWRGKAQFGLIVQGYSVEAKQGSGVGDNIFETDGSESADAQPVTTACIYNFTAIGQPVDGDYGTAWRANAHVQYRNCIFMDLGDVLVRLENDGDNTKDEPGYATYRGTAVAGSYSDATVGLPQFHDETWASDSSNVWNTPFSVTSKINAAASPAAGAFNHPAEMYQAQSSGYLCEISDSIFFRNNKSTAYDLATDVGVLAAAMNNVKIDAAAGVDTDLPIVKLERGSDVVITGYDSSPKVMQPVTKLNPCAANDALTSVAAAPDDGFFTPANYRGAFSANNNWLADWSAAAEFGLLEGTFSSVQEWTMY